MKDSFSLPISLMCLAVALLIGGITYSVIQGAAQKRFERCMDHARLEASLGDTQGALKQLEGCKP